MDEPLISVITINYNSLAHTRGMLASFRQITYPRVEIIVVDNASKEDPSILLNEFPEIILVKNPLNEGFAGGNNRGIEIAKGTYFFLINNDTVVSSNVLESLLKRAKMSDRVGLVCPKINYFDDPTIIQYAGFTAINPLTGRNRGIGYQEMDQGQYQEPRITYLAHGAAMFLPRKVVEHVGMMAELYFLYYEEIDYCERIKKAGYEIWYEPNATILHKESMSVGKNSLLKTFYMSRNRWIFLRRNIKWPIFLLTSLYYFFIALPKNLIMHVLKGEFKHANTYLKGFSKSIFIKDLHSNPPLTSNTP